jgi:hypothetical protein
MRAEGGAHAEDEGGRWDEGRDEGGTGCPERPLLALQWQIMMKLTERRLIHLCK